MSEKNYGGVTPRVCNSCNNTCETLYCPICNTTPVPHSIKKQRPTNFAEEGLTQEDFFILRLVLLKQIEECKKEEWLDGMGQEVLRSILVKVSYLWRSKSVLPR